jgi:formylglycine-generating enzyme required for sulfatase activity
MAREGGTLMMLQIDWVAIPAGTLPRGTPTAELDNVVARHADLDGGRGLPRHYFAKECPRAAVRVGRFLLARTPVTVGQWIAFAAATGTSFTPLVPPDHPVTDRSWEEAEAFCAWAAELTGLPVRLPAEIEWERAVRGDDAREYPWGDVWDPHRANLLELGVGASLPVGQLPAGASPFGILDMAGNVDEWTGTLYAPYPGALPEVPAVEQWAADPHVTRGGGHHHARDLARCARRHGVYPPTAGAGLRLAV